MEIGEQALTKAGLKATTARVRILRYLEAAHEQGRHLNAEELFMLSMQDGERIGVSTVYRVLLSLEQAGLVRRHQFDQGAVGPAVYEPSRGEPHDHMVCVDTDTITDFRDPVIEERQRHIAEAHGYEVIGRELVIRVRRRARR